MPDKLKNPYRKPTEEDKALAEKKKKDLEKIRKEAEALANKCINHSSFVKYREKYLKLRELTIDSLINYEEPDPLKYAFGVRTALTKLHQLRLLLDAVNLDNRPKGKK